MERLHQAASRAITGCLSSSPIPLLLTEASLPPLQVTLTDFTLLSYERALRLPTFFPISGLARLGVRSRLSRSSWRAFASTHSLMLSSTCSREALLACPLFPPWNLPSFTVESTLSSPCSRSDPPLSRQGAALAHLDSLPPHDLVLWTDGSVPFPFGKGGSGVLANCFLCGHSLLLGSCLSRIGRIENPSCSACGHSSQDTSHLILHCPATDSLRRSLFGDSLSLYDLWSRPWGVAWLLGLHGLPPCPHPSEGVG